MAEAKKKATKAKKATTAAKKKTTERKVRAPKALGAFGGYFVGAWREIRQVRWPNRRATWSLTVAVLGFSLFWGLIIFGLDLLNQAILNRLILQ